jgi:hypothetical protein
MSKAKISLGAAVRNAEAVNAGYRAVSAMPSLEGGRPIAVVILMKGETLKKVTEKLD